MPNPGRPVHLLEVTLAIMKHAPMKDRTRIGEVKFLMEEMAEARAASASCVHVEAALEPDTKVSFSKKKPAPEREDPAATLRRIRKRVLGGSYLLVDKLTADELAAAQNLIFKGEAEIVLSACKPFLVAKLDKIMIS